jgi:hypothetical protein
VIIIKLFNRYNTDISPLHLYSFGGNFTDTNFNNMNFLQNRFNYVGVLKLTLINAIWLSFALSVKAIPINNSNDFYTIDNQPKVCPSANLLPKRRFDTAKYSIYICRGDKVNSLGYYVRISKSDGSNMTVPVSSNTGETYVAVKDQSAYAVTPYEMIATKNNRLILREKVVNAIAGNGQSLASACPEGQNPLVEAQTKSFLVYICVGDPDASYVAIARNADAYGQRSYRKITLPLQSYNSHPQTKTKQYVAVMGDTRYVLTSKVLKVSQNGRTVIKEKVLHWN